ncbi:MAG TPA: protein kinase [Terracidiphilus sp.]|jgi:Tol biopolymer transport system component
MPLASHQFIDHYEILALVGAGGMGEVYRARDTRLNRDVAIKVLPGFSTTDSNRLRRFELEARAAAALNHPNILAVYQMGVFDGAPYLVSELLEGETLRDRLKNGPLPLRKMIDYGTQIARGLAAAHEKGIVHRDLKPENLFVTRDGQVKILDFGLARLTQPRELEFPQLPQETPTVAGVLLGSVGYMSPEQVRGQVADARSDIFTFSAVLYEMVAGKRAFQKLSSIDTMSAILNEEPAPLMQVAPSAPPGLERLVHRGLEKNPEQRFQSASDLGFALQALSDTAQSTTFTSSYRVAETRPVGSRKRWLAIGTVAVLLVLAIAWYLWMRPVPAPQVAKYVQLTHDGMQKSLVGTDGSRIFLTMGDSGVEDIEAIPVEGGEAARISMPSADMVPVDLTSDGSTFLVIDGTGYPMTGALWRLPVFGGSARRLGDATGHVGAWSADGKQLVYANGGDVFFAKADGSDARKIATTKNIVSGLAISTDDSEVRVETEEISQSGTSVVAGERTIWNVSTKGSDPRPMIADWPNTTDECCGKWTVDGKYFIFQSGGQIWALPNGSRWFPDKPKPVQLTASPMQLHSPLPSRDGKKLFVVGMTFRGELTSFDLKTGKPSLFLGGISADWMEVSRDGKQVVYVSYPQGDLWKSNVDGTGRMQLTFGQVKPVLPRWSPDGETILFFDFPGGPNHPGKIYEVPAVGGLQRVLLPTDTLNEQDPTWSPDGKRIAFAGDPNDANAINVPAIRILTVQTGQVAPVPGSEKMFSPRWSPDGRYLAAMTSDSSHLMLFDFDTQKWKEIGSGTLSWINWSKDSQYVYQKNLTGRGSVDRVRITDGKVEKLVDLKDFVFTGLGGGSVSVGPDDLVLLLRDRGTQDVYALDWIEP